MRFNARTPSSYFPRRELFRLMSMMMLLAVVGMTMYRARDPGMWKWLADDVREDDAKVEITSDKAEAKVGSDQSDSDKDNGDRFVETLMTGPNDLQPFEQSQADYIFQAISDKAPLAAEEMPAYWKLMRWSMTENFDDLWNRAHKDRYFTHLAEAPQKHRGELIGMKVSLRRSLAHEASENSAGAKQVYEAWGVTNESRTGLYCLVFYDKPPELPLSPSIHEEAQFVGYFLKLFAYEDAMGTSRWAPILIGRLRWRENPVRSSLKRQREEQELLPWVIGGAAIVVLFVGLWTRSYLRAGQLLQAEGEVDHAAIEQWLETNTDSGDDGAASGTGWTEFVESVDEPQPASLTNSDRNFTDEDASDRRRT